MGVGCTGVSVGSGVSVLVGVPVGKSVAVSVGASVGVSVSGICVGKSVCVGKRMTWVGRCTAIIGSI